MQGRLEVVRICHALDSNGGAGYGALCVRRARRYRIQGPHTAEEFTKYAVMLCRDAALRKRIGEAARDAVMERHTVAACAEQWRARGRNWYSRRGMKSARAGKRAGAE
jgi:hypothetical protein